MTVDVEKVAERSYSRCWGDYRRVPWDQVGDMVRGIWRHRVKVVLEEHEREVAIAEAEAARKARKKRKSNR